jgi:hypothetical protein
MEKKTSKFIKLCKKYGVDPDKVPEILSFEAACKVLRLNPKKLPIVTGIPARHRKRNISDYKLTIIAEAIRGKDKLNYNDTNQAKWFPYFRVKADAKRPSGFGLSFNYYGSWYSYSDVGVRLCFLEWNQAKFFGMHFLKLHEEHHLYK